jgi:hypothetical protein
MQCRRYQTYSPKSEGAKYHLGKVGGVYESNTNDFVTGIYFEFVVWIQLNKNRPIFRLLLWNYCMWSHKRHRREFLNRYANWQLLTGDSDLMASGQEHRWTSLSTLITTKVIFVFALICTVVVLNSFVMRVCVCVCVCVGVCVCMGGCVCVCVCMGGFCNVWVSW